MIRNNFIFLFQSLSLLQQVARFIIVGILAAVLHFAIVVLLVKSYGLNPLIANLFGFLGGFQVSYWGHKLWTFKAVNVLHRTAVPKLLIVQLFNLFMNESFFYLLLRLELPYQVALFIVLACFPLLTFLTSKWWVFKSEFN